jgi:hypothetical protein
MPAPTSPLVMPGLVPGIHVLGPATKDVDGRDVRAKQSFVASPGHDASFCLSQAMTADTPRLAPILNTVMPGLVPGIHVLGPATKDVDGRDKPGHDAWNFNSHDSPSSPSLPT